MNPAESSPQQTEPEPKAEGKSVELTKSLHEAASEGDLEKVKKLIISGADINAKNKSGQTPLGLVETARYKTLSEVLRKYREKTRRANLSL